MVLALTRWGAPNCKGLSRDDGGGLPPQPSQTERYIIQLRNRCRKYYKTLFFGLIDLVVVNAYVTHSACRTRNGESALRRSEFMTRLQQQLVDVKASDFSDAVVVSTTGTPLPKTKRRTSAAHKPNITDDWRGVGQTRKRRTRTCKVCSLLHRKSGQTAAQTA